MARAVTVTVTVAGAVLATANGTPAAVSRGSARTPAAAPASSLPAPVAPSRPAPVAPLHGLRWATLLVVAPFSLSRSVLAAMARLPGVTGTEPIEAAKIKINGRYTAVLGVDPSTFRGYAAAQTAASSRLWQGVADGGVAVSYTMGTLDRLTLGGRVTVAGQRQERLPVVAFGTVGIGGVDAVVSHSVARSLGVPAGNAIIISAPPSGAAWLAARIRHVLPAHAAVEALVTQVTRAGATAGTIQAAVGGAAPAAGTEPAGSVPAGSVPAGSVPAGSAPAGSVPAAGDAMSAAQLATALLAAESRRGLPYVWGAAGPSSFDCSGLVQWAFAQAGVSMPRVAADQARTGPAVPVSQLQPGDLMFFHTDPTDPGYISHVAMYLGDGWMIQAPQPGQNVEVVPASLGAEFAGAVRVYPPLAAALASGLT